MNESESTANDNWQLEEKLPISMVDNLANDLCKEYENRKYFRWYCLVINILGFDRIREIQARCKDSKYPAQLFSRIASEEAKAKVGLERYQRLRGRHGGS